MNPILKICVATTTFVLLCGCAATPQLQAYNGMVTTGGDGVRFEQIPTNRVDQKDNVVVITHIRWDPPTEDGGVHTVDWKWYSNGGLVASRERDVHFRKSPWQLWWNLPATDFPPGHYHVDVAIDDHVVDAHDFDVVAN